MAATIRLRSKTACLAIVPLMMGLQACAAGPPSRPSPPPPPLSQRNTIAPPTSASTLLDATLSGRVYEVIEDARVGIEGASVYCEQCGESTHNFAITDTKGEYLFPPGVWDEGRGSFPIRILVAKEGYQDPPGTPTPTPPNPAGPGWREVVVNGNTRFEMQLVRK